MLIFKTLFDLRSVKVLSFRSDINFLRALSVVAVIIYHIDKKLLPGGWLGVDIFFFISGYLISNKIITELNHKNFSFKNFYIKRIKRILPSIISMSLFSLPLAFILLPPKELYFFISSVISSIFFYSNIYFENFDFYNSPSSKYIPFLHMWSLSVEEQFYLILPLILFFVFKKKKKKLIISIFSIFLFSITLNIFSEFFNTFYQIQFRFWEFLFGVLFNFLNKEISISKVFKVFGFGIILLSLLIFDDILINILYPKLIALIGVFIFLIKSDESVFFDNLFNNSFIKYTGFISYSLYLFHQPVFSFFRIYEKNIKEFPKYTIFLLIVLLYILSFINWKIVEQPFLNKFNKTKALILFGAFFAISSLSLISINDFSFFGRYSNLPNKTLLLTVKNQNVISQNGKSCENRRIEETCYFQINETGKNLYVLGDSALRTLSTSILKYNNTYNFNLIHLGGNGCLYLYEKKLNNNLCPNKTAKEMDNYVDQINNSIILYGGRLPFYISGEGFDNSFVIEDEKINISVDLKLEIPKTLKKLIEQNNTIVLIYPIPEQGWNVPNRYFYGKANWGEAVYYPHQVWKERVLESKLILDSIVSEKIVRIYPEDIFCDSFVRNNCVGSFENDIFYSDDDHLSLVGANLLAKNIIDNIQYLLD